MKILFILLSFCFLLLVGCDDESSDQSPTTETPKAPSTSQPSKPVIKDWGELKCQKAKNCSNPILNLKKVRIEYFLEGPIFKTQYKSANKDILIFQCGIEFLRSWRENFFGQGDLEKSTLTNLSTFTSKILNKKKCLIHSNYKVHMKNYFKNTKEYKDEVQ